MEFRGDNVDKLFDSVGQHECDIQQFWCLQQVEFVIAYTAGLTMGCCPSCDVVEDVLSNLTFLAAAVAKWINCMWNDTKRYNLSTDISAFYLGFVWKCW